jgi:anti-anti-sigma regulatory factor
MADHLRPVPGEAVLAAPAQLVGGAGQELRRRGLALLESLPEGRGRLVVDLGATQDADSEGLAALIAIRRRARERRQRVSLRRVRPNLGELLRLTKLDRQFEIESWEAENAG